jgi:hypothetical protein
MAHASIRGPSIELITLRSDLEQVPRACINNNDSNECGKADVQWSDLAGSMQEPQRADRYNIVVKADRQPRGDVANSPMLLKRHNMMPNYD